jgi:hypothetical protein
MLSENLRPIYVMHSGGRPLRVGTDKIPTGNALTLTWYFCYEGDEKWKPLAKKTLQLWSAEDERREAARKAQRGRRKSAGGGRGAY